VKSFSGGHRFLNFVGHQPCAVYHGQHVDLVLFYAADNPVGFFDQLADIFGLVLGDHAARIRLVAYLF
jgi:hypothetical protein